MNLFTILVTEKLSDKTLAFLRTADAPHGNWGKLGFLITHAYLRDQNSFQNSTFFVMQKFNLLGLIWKKKQTFIIVCYDL